MTCNTLYSDGTGISGHSPTPRRESIESLAKHIRLLVLDVDGVMTDGGLYYDANGLVMKRFHVLDGIGIRLAKTAGIEVAVLSGMDVPCVVRRLEVLGVTEYHGGADNKCTILDGMRKRMSLEMIGSISHQCPAWGCPLPSRMPCRTSKNWRSS